MAKIYFIIPDSAKKKKKHGILFYDSAMDPIRRHTFAQNRFRHEKEPLFHILHHRRNDSIRVMRNIIGRT